MLTLYSVFDIDVFYFSDAWYAKKLSPLYSIIIILWYMDIYFCPAFVESFAY